MTPPLVRERLRQALHRIDQPNAGLLLTRGWTDYVQGEGDADNRQVSKASHIDKVCHQHPSTLYLLAYDRWQETTADAARFRSLYAELQHRMFIGLSASSAIETGVCSSHSYGMPMIPGSSVKGCARGYAKQIGTKTEYLAVLFGEDKTEDGREPGAGSLVWHDAWWIPGKNSHPFVREVVTVHHPDYYAGKADATDFDSPVPNAQIAVQGSFYFVVEGDPAWAELALKLLKAALAETGIGAKRAAGYGFMAVDQQAMSKASAVRMQALEQTQSPEEKVRSRLGEMNDKALAEKFGIGLNATRREYTEDEWALVPGLAMEIYGALIDSWSDETKTSNKTKFKARRFFLGLKSEG